MSKKGERKICITVDDIPGASFPKELGSRAEVILETNRRIVDVFRSFDVDATGFVSPRNRDLCAVPVVSEDVLVNVIEEWLDAGCSLGNHTLTHPSVNHVSPAEYFGDVLEAEKILKPVIERRGSELRYFRHPYLHTGDCLDTKEKLSEFLTRHRYVTAPVTVDTEDWVFAQAFARAHERRDDEAKIDVIARYLEFTLEVTVFFEELSCRIFGYEIPQILLIHNSYLTAMCANELLNLFHDRGYSFISLDEALQSEAYNRIDPYIGAGCPSWLQRWALDTSLGFVERPKEPQDLLKIACNS